MSQNIQKNPEKIAVLGELPGDAFVAVYNAKVSGGPKNRAEKFAANHVTSVPDRLQLAVDVCSAISSKANIPQCSLIPLEGESAPINVYSKVLSIAPQCNTEEGLYRMVSALLIADMAVRFGQVGYQSNQRELNLMYTEFEKKIQLVREIAQFIKHNEFDQKYLWNRIDSVLDETRRRTFRLTPSIDPRHKSPNVTLSEGKVRLAYQKSLVALVNTLADYDLEPVEVPPKVKSRAKKAVSD